MCLLEEFGQVGAGRFKKKLVLRLLHVDFVFRYQVLKVSCITQSGKSIHILSCSHSVRLLSLFYSPILINCSVSLTVHSVCSLLKGVSFNLHGKILRRKKCTLCQTLAYVRYSFLRSNNSEFIALRVQIYGGDRLSAWGAQEAAHFLWPKRGQRFGTHLGHFCC